MRVRIAALLAALSAGIAAGAGACTGDDPDTRVTFDRDAGSDAASSVDAGPPKLVFVTSESFTGALGGPIGADEECERLAKAVGLSGNFVAWLSAGTVPAASRLDPLGGAPPSGRKRIDGVVVAATHEALLGGTLAAPIDRDEKGAAVPSASVWTNTNPRGEMEREGYDCQGFTKVVPEDGRPASAFVGSTSSTAGAWTASGTALPCTESARLYCFEL